MTGTQLNTEAVKVSAADLGRIMDDMSAFTSLQASFPALGEFDLAQQLRTIVDDRRSGVVAHAEALRTSLTEIAAALTKIATQVQTIDDGTAADIRATVLDLRTRVGQDLVVLGSQAS